VSLAFVVYVSLHDTASLTRLCFAWWLAYPQPEAAVQTSNGGAASAKTPTNQY